MVKVINIDPTGKIRLSKKALMQDEAGSVAVGVPEAPNAKTTDQQRPRREHAPKGD